MRISGLASGLALAVRPAGLAEAPALKGGPEDRFCEAVRNDLRVPLTLEGPTRTMRGVPPRSLRHLHGDRRIRRNVYGLAVVLAGAAAGYGGDPRWPVTGAAVRGSRRAVGLASEGRGESCRPIRRVSRGEPRPPTAGHPGRFFSLTARVRPRCSRPGPSGLARRRCALEALEKSCNNLRWD